MTKYEWETELKKNISGLPKSEIERVLEYYNELFADNAERGMSEKDIVREFGNPHDVANRIMESSSAENYDDEFSAREREAEEYIKLVSEKTDSDRRTDGGKSGKREKAEKKPRSTAGKVIAFIPLVLVAVVLGAVSVSVFAGGIAAAVCGAAEFVIAFAEIGAGLWQTVAKLGFALIAAGGGVLLGLLGAKMCKSVFIMCKRFFAGKTASENRV